MFEKGGYIVYGTTGVCLVEEITGMKMKGASGEKLYYVLRPCFQKGNTIFTPVDNSKIAMRAVMNKAEAEALVERQMKLCRNIVRLVYHENDVYDFDLCGPLYPLPNLECGERLAASMEGSSRYYLYLTQLQKGYNRVMEYCGQILELL